MAEFSYDVPIVKEELDDEEMVSNDDKKGTRSSGGKKSSKRGRKPSKIDVKAKLERSRQSARECRARKKLRYQYLEELVANRERSVFQLRKELDLCKDWASIVDTGTIPAELIEHMENDARRRAESNSSSCSYVMRPRRRVTTGRTESESSVASSSISVQSP